MKGKGLKFKDKTSRYYQFGALAVALCLVITAVGIATITINETSGIIDSDGISLLITPYSYIISKTGTSYFCSNGSNGLLVQSNTNFSKVMQDTIELINNTGVGGFIFIKSGIYWVTKEILLCDGLTISGNSMSHNTGGTKLEIYPGVNDTNIFYYNSRTSQSVSGISIKGIIFDGNSGTNSNVTGAKFGYDTRAFTIHDCIFSDFDNSGLNISRGLEVMVTNCEFKNGNGSGLWINEGFRIIVSECIFEANDGYGLYTETGTAFIDHCSFYNNGKGGASVRMHNTVTNCWFQDNDGTENGAQLEVTNDWNVIEGNYFSCGGTDYAIYRTSWSDYCVYDDNMIYNEGKADINSVGSGNCNIINGISYNAGVPGTDDDWATHNRTGVMVWDTTASKLYIYGNSTWNILN